jgi:hypothetical protein
MRSVGNSTYTQLPLVTVTAAVRHWHDHQTEQAIDEELAQLPDYKTNKEWAGFLRKEIAKRPSMRLRGRVKTTEREKDDRC